MADLEQDPRYQRIAESWRRLRDYPDVVSDPDDWPDLEAASRISYLFMTALRRYEPAPFDGEVDAILSKDRAIWGSEPGFYLRALSNDLRIHEVGRDHNNLFGEHLPEVAKEINDILRDAP